MTQEDEEEWITWRTVQKEAVETWISGDIAGAIRLISQYLESSPPKDLRRQAIAFRGDLHEEQGDLDNAKIDLTYAHELSEGPDYERYTLEISLGSIANLQGDTTAADHWYIDALRTASESPATSGGTALRRLLELRKTRGLEGEERQLAVEVAQRSWLLLRIEGEPDLEDLEDTARKLVAAQNRS